MKTVATFLLLLLCFNCTWGVTPTADFDTLSEDVEEVVIAKSVESISPYAFAERPNLRKVGFEAGSKCVSIGEGAFYRCTSLESIDVPPSLREIGTNAFAWCSALKSIDLSRTIKIGSLSFAYCESLESVDFSPKLKSIGNNAFSRCSSLREVIIPDSVTLLESYAFADCKSLVKARLPANDALLGELIFDGCASLTELEQPSPYPPDFDCASFIFEPSDSEAYSRCLLRTANPDAYRSSPGWKLFQHISSLN